MYDLNAARKAANLNVAQQLQSKVNVNQADTTVIAGVGKASGSKTYLGNLQPLIIQHTAGTAAEIIKIGDPFDAVRVANGIGATSEYSDTTASTWTAAVLAQFAIAGFTIREINYQVDSATQFSQPLRYMSADMSKSTGGKNLAGMVKSQQRSVDQNTLIRTIEFTGADGQLVIDTFNALFLTVASERTVTLTVTPGASVEQ